MKKYIVLSVIAMMLTIPAKAQQKIFDPTLDPEVRINLVNTSKIGFHPAYMWYPGQLASYRQQWLREQSQARCMDVGYVGKFNPMQEVTWFKVQVVAKETTSLG